MRPTLENSFPGGRPHNEIWTACAVYLALLCLAYGNVIFRGKSIVYSDNYNPIDPPLRASSYGKNFVPVQVWNARGLLQIANFHDAGATFWQWEPASEFLRKAIRDGEMPFWDPYIGAGAPSMSSQTPAYFFPPSFLLVLLGDTALLKNVYFLGIAFFAGLFTFLLLRRHGVGFLGSLAGGTAFMFCGGISQNVGSFIGQTAACIPLTLLTTAWFFDHPTRRRMVGLAAIYAGVSLASFPPVLAQAFGTSVLYALWRFLSGEAADAASDRRRAILRWAAAASIGAALVAWYYVPALAVIKSTPQVAKAYADAAQTSLPLLCLFQLLSPTLMGGSKILEYPPFPDPFFLQLPYIGVVAVILALLAAPRDGRRRLVWSFAWTAAVLVVLKIFGIPPVQWIAAIPGLSSIHFAAYFGILLNFLIAVLAGLGLDSLFRGEAGASRVCLAAGALMVAVLSLRQDAIGKGVPDHLFARGWEHAWLILLAISIVASGLVVAGAWTRGRNRWAVAVGLAIVLLGGLEGVRNSVYPRQYRWDAWRHPVPYVRKLAADEGFFRSFAVGALPANTNSPFGIFSLDSVTTFNSPRIHALYRRYAGGKLEVLLREASLFPPEPVLDSASIAYVVVRKDLAWAQREAFLRGYASVYADTAATIFWRPATPRYFFTTDYRIRDSASALDDLATYAPARQVITEAALSFPPQRNPIFGPDVTVVAFHRNRFTVSLEAPRPGLLVCSESDFPGWTATINGRRGKILPVNYAFRGVEVPAGRVEVHFRYWPPGLTAGLAISIFGMAVFGALLLSAKTEGRDQKTLTGISSFGTPFPSNHVTSSSTRSS